MPYNRMIPKSGYRFSDRIMRKRPSNDSAEHHRVTPKPVVGPVFGSIVLGEYFPGFVSLNPGYKAKK